MKTLKTKRGRIILCCLIVIVLAVLTYITIDFYSDENRSDVKFKVADTDNPTSLFSVEVVETSDGKETDEGLTFSNICPGQVIEKNPTIRNTGMYDAYVRLIMTIDCAAGWEDALDGDSLLSIFDIDTETWEIVETVDTETDTAVYTCYLLDVLEPGEEATLFEHVTIPGKFTAEDMVGIAEFHISFYGQSIQSQGTGDSAMEAFTNFWGS